MQNKSNVMLLVILSLFICSSASETQQQSGWYPRACPRNGWCVKNFATVTQEVYQSNSGYRLFYRGMDGIDNTPTNIPTNTFTSKSMKSYVVPYWTDHTYSNFKNVCKEVYNSLLKKKVQVYNWDCDTMDPLIKSSLQLSGNIYNCYIKYDSKRTYESRKHKELSHEYGKDQMILNSTIQGFSYIDYNFWLLFNSGKHCNWFCGMVDRYCAEVYNKKDKLYYYVC